MQVLSLGQEDSLEEVMATHSSIVAWRILWTEEPGGLQSIGLQRVGHNWSDLPHSTQLLAVLIISIKVMFLLHEFLLLSSFCPSSTFFAFYFCYFSFFFCFQVLKLLILTKYHRNEPKLNRYVHECMYKILLLKKKILNRQFKKKDLKPILWNWFL